MTTAKWMACALSTRVLPSTASRTKLLYQVQLDDHRGTTSDVLFDVEGRGWSAGGSRRRRRGSPPILTTAASRRPRNEVAKPRSGAGDGTHAPWYQRRCRIQLSAGRDHRNRW